MPISLSPQTQLVPTDVSLTVQHRRTGATQLPPALPPPSIALPTTSTQPQGRHPARRRLPAPGQLGSAAGHGSAVRLPLFLTLRHKQEIRAGLSLCVPVKVTAPGQPCRPCASWSGVSLTAAFSTPRPGCLTAPHAPPPPLLPSHGPLTWHTWPVSRTQLLLSGAELTNHVASTDHRPTNTS